MTFQRWVIRALGEGGEESGSLEHHPLVDGPPLSVSLSLPKCYLGARKGYPSSKVREEIK